MSNTKNKVFWDVELSLQQQYSIVQDSLRYWKDQEDDHFATSKIKTRVKEIIQDLEKQLENLSRKLKIEKLQKEIKLTQEWNAISTANKDKELKRLKEALKVLLQKDKE